MIVNPLISISIPTYNRAKFLDLCLEANIPVARAHNIQIFISDNASTDDTQLVVNRRMAEYPLIRYSRNDTNLGMDNNFEKAFKFAETEYIWLLGDSYIIPSEGIDYLLECISDRTRVYDALVFNVENRVREIPAQVYADRNKLLSDIAWHMTCVASLVYNAKVIKNANFERYKNTDLVQIGVILDCISNRDFLINWKDSISVQFIKNKDLKRVSWESRTFEIWAERWPNLIFSLPVTYKLDVKLKCIKDHGVKSGIFSLSGLLLLRISNRFNWKVYEKYSVYFPISIDYPQVILFFISLCPLFIIKLVKKDRKSVV